MSGALDPSAPILVGWGVASQRVDDPLKAHEPLELMKRAVSVALGRAGAAGLGAAIDRVYVPRGRWSYANPGVALAAAAGAAQATTILANVGVLQQTLIGDACQRISDGEAEVALVGGGDCGYRLRQAAGASLPEAQQASRPDITLAPAQELCHPAELRVGLDMPVGNYALIHSAYAARRGMTPESLQKHASELFSSFSAIAAGNPDAWSRVPVSAEEIATPGSGNRMQAYPYTRMLCSDWSVDQAAALIFCSVRKARELGIAADRWIHPLASTESNYMTQVVSRGDLAACPGARIAGRAALAGAGLEITDIDLLELYSCFPAAVEIFANELGVPEHRPLSVTGGMPFAGGPYNNYVIQATCRMADLLDAARADRGGARRGLVSSVSGRMTKQGFGLWSSVPGQAFAFRDVSETTAQAMQVRDVSMDYSGPATVVGCTVMYERGVASRAVVIAEGPGPVRVAAQNAGEAAIAAAKAGLVGAAVTISDGHSFTPA